MKIKERGGAEDLDNDIKIIGVNGWEIGDLHLKRCDGTRMIITNYFGV